MKRRGRKKLLLGHRRGHLRISPIFLLVFSAAGGLLIDLVLQEGNTRYSCGTAIPKYSTVY